MAIDMWSLGCILAELYTGYPLFPGENEVEQLSCIIEIFGLPDPALLAEAQRRKLFFGKFLDLVTLKESLYDFFNNATILLITGVCHEMLVHSLVVSVESHLFE